MLFLYLLFISVLLAPVNFKNLFGLPARESKQIKVPVLSHAKEAVELDKTLSRSVATVASPSFKFTFKKLGEVVINSKPIGEGFYARTFLTEAKAGQEAMVIKIPKFKPLKDPQNEIDALKKMDLFLESAVNHDGRVFIAMKLVKGVDLSSFMSEIKTLKIFQQIKMATFKAMEDMHSKGVIHNDLHAGNIMIEKIAPIGNKNPFKVTFIDFGMANIVPRFLKSQSTDEADLELMFKWIAGDLGFK
jgi:serine/threonine protein kinase